MLRIRIYYIIVCVAVVDRAKDAKKDHKSMVSYEKGGARFRKEDYDDRDPGLGWEECESIIQ